MKSQAKVKRQRRIKNILVLMWGFRMRGLMRAGLSETPSNDRRKAVNRVQNRSRRMNRNSK